MIQVPTPVADVLLALLALAMVLAFVRLLLGPSLPDRVVALDLMTTIAVAMIAGYAAAKGQPVLLDAAIVLALISFVGTVAFARYVERRAQRPAGGAEPWPRAAPEPADTPVRVTNSGTESQGLE
jgi:multicomponent Na+:H+ antiporter subunit F